MTVDASAGPSSQPQACWICGGDGTTREHGPKRTDLKAMFGDRRGKPPLIRTNSDGAWTRVQGPSSERLKYDAPVCEPCNTNRTQAHDRAWDRLRTWLMATRPTKGTTVRTGRLFRADWRAEMRNVHLFFVKQFGCAMVEGGPPFDVSSLGAAILSNTSHPNFYLHFGIAQDAVRDAVALSDADAVLDGGKPVIVMRTYYVGSLGVLMLCDNRENGRVRTMEAWHPRRRDDRLLINDVTGDYPWPKREGASRSIPPASSCHRDGSPPGTAAPRSPTRSTATTGQRRPMLRVTLAGDRPR